MPARRRRLLPTMMVPLAVRQLPRWQMRPRLLTMHLKMIQARMPAPLTVLQSRPPMRAVRMAPGSTRQHQGFLNRRRLMMARPWTIMGMVRPRLLIRKV